MSISFNKIAAITAFLASSALALPASDRVPDLFRRDGDCGDNSLRVHIDNQMGDEMSVQVQNGASGGNFCGGSTPGYTTIPAGGSIDISTTDGWNGAFFVLPSKFGQAGAGSTKLEGSWKDGEMHYDVSFNDGFSVPATCWVTGSDPSGCTHDLFKLADCPASNAAKSPPGTCHNEMQTEQTPITPWSTPGTPMQRQKLVDAGIIANVDDVTEAEGSSIWYRNLAPWFAMCEGAGYIGQYDDMIANKKATPPADDHTLYCCIGENCNKPAAQLEGDWRAQTKPADPSQFTYTWSAGVPWQ